MSYLPSGSEPPIQGEAGVSVSDIEIATCSFGEFRPEMGYPIRTSIGAPKWFSHPYMNWDNVFPKRYFLSLEYDDYRPRYMEMLHKHGVEKLRGDLEFMSEEYAKVNDGEVRPLVLLCYEKLSKGPANWCHRTMIAEYLETDFGTNVVELGAQLTQVDPPEPPLALF